MVDVVWVVVVAVVRARIVSEWCVDCGLGCFGGCGRDIEVELLKALCCRIEKLWTFVGVI